MNRFGSWLGGSVMRGVLAGSPGWWCPKCLKVEGKAGAVGRGVGGPSYPLPLTVVNKQAVI